MRTESQLESLFDSFIKNIKIFYNSDQDVDKKVIIL